MMMPGRQFKTTDYKCGYQGSEKDNEITCQENRNITTFYREGDTYTGQWWSSDNAKPNPSESPYAMMGRNPILYNDVKGDTVWLYATTLPGSPGWAYPATHTFLVVKTSDNVPHYYVYGPADDNAPVGGSPLVRKSWGDGLNGGYPQDKKIINGTDKDNFKDKFLINLPEGMNQDEFDKKVINVAESFGNNPGIEYNALSCDPTTGNCNTSTTTILSKSGVSDKVIDDIDSRMKGICWGFGDKKPWTKEEQSKAVEQKMKDDNLKKELRKIEGPSKF